MSNEQFRLNDHDLTVLVERGSQGAHDSRASIHGGPGWILLDPAQQNIVREAALPFIFHGTKALEELGYRKPRTITTAEELDALPNGSAITDALGEAFLANRDYRHGQVVRLWYYGGNGAFRSDRIALPATVIYEPEATA